MVKSKNDAKSNYRKGIDKVGIKAYQDASDANTISEAAKILEKAAGKGDELSISDMANNWADRY